MASLPGSAAAWTGSLPNWPPFRHPASKRLASAPFVQSQGMFSVDGTVKGTINVRDLVVLKSARIQGDVHYDSLTIEQGAQVDGRFAPRAVGEDSAVVALAAG